MKIAGGLHHPLRVADGAGVQHPVEESFVETDSLRAGGFHRTAEAEDGVADAAGPIVPDRVAGNEQGTQERDAADDGLPSVPAAPHAGMFLHPGLTQLELEPLGLGGPEHAGQEERLSEGVDRFVVGKNLVVVPLLVVVLKGLEPLSGRV